MVPGVLALPLETTSRSLLPSSMGSPALSRAHAVHASRCPRGISACYPRSSQLSLRLHLDSDLLPCRIFPARPFLPQVPALSLQPLVQRLHDRGRILIVVQGIRRRTLRLLQPAW